MDLKLQLLEEHSRRNVDLIVKTIGSDKKKFAALINIVYTGEQPLPQRASWVVAMISGKHPEMLKPYLNKLIETLEDFKISGIRRNLMQAIASQEIPEEYRSLVLDRCIRQMMSADEPVAVKVWAMEIASAICVLHPEIWPELKSVIEIELPKNSPAFSSRAKRVLAKGPEKLS
jgi:hypothetical protein